MSLSRSSASIIDFLGILSQYVPKLSLLGGKEIQTTAIPDRASRSHVHHPPSFGPNVKTTAVEDQQGYQDMPHGEQSLDPMCAEVEVVADGWATICGKKKVRLTSTNEKRDQDITFHMQNQGIVPFMNPLPLCI